MSLGMSDAYKRINESHYPGRIRETSLSQERADEKRHLAELEEFVKKHKGEHAEKDDSDAHEEDAEEKQQAPQPTDTLELHDSAPQHPPEQQPSSAENELPRTSDGHLDIRI